MSALGKNGLVNFLTNFKKEFDIKKLEYIEEYLITTGIHIPIVLDIMNHIVQKITLGQISSNNDIYNTIHKKITSIIKPFANPIELDQEHKPHIIMIFGINGSGKTTTAGKMVHLLSSLGWSVTLAACDTFRAAAKEQLEHWSRVQNASIIYKENQSESPAKIAIKAINFAREKDIDIVIIDTAGRIHNNTNLVLELINIQSSISKVYKNAPHQNVFILDANAGYNAINQVEIFHDKIGINGIILTKIDIAQNLGAIISICKKYKINIYGVADGETKDNIKDLDVNEFATNLLKNLKLE